MDAMTDALFVLIAIAAMFTGAALLADWVARAERKLIEWANAICENYADHD